MNVEAVCMLVPGITALIYREKSGIAFLITILACLAIGVPLVSRKPSKKAFYAREGLVTTALSWIVLSIVGAVPFVLSGAIPNPIDAFFEIVSGFTTTGSSILSDPSQMPYSINIWRCFSHWIGGMGVLVFILTLLPLAGGYHMNLMKAESPGPSVGKLLPKVQSTAKILYKIYITLTVALIILLLLGGMPLYDSLCAAFGTAGTGGFGIKSDSMGSYSLYIQIVITIFMILFGVNFNVYFLLLTRKFSQALKSEEVRCYFFVIIASALMITFNVRHLFDNGGKHFNRHFSRLVLLSPPPVMPLRILTSGLRYPERSWYCLPSVVPVPAVQAAESRFPVFCFLQNPSARNCIFICIPMQ